MKAFFRKNFYFIAFSVLLALIIVLIGAFSTKQLVRHARGEILEENYAALNVLSHFVDDELREMESLAGILSRSSFAVEGLLEMNDPRKFADMNKMIDRYARIFDNFIVYILDLKGEAVVSSNREAKDSFVGKSYVSRPYFQKAVKGEESNCFAIGTTTKKRGFCASAPVRDYQNNIIGVVVIKKNMEKLEAFFVKNQHVFLVDENGVILLSYLPDFLFKTVVPLTQEQKDKIRESRQYGDYEFHSLLDRHYEHGDIVRIFNEKMVYSLHPIADRGWDIVIFGSAERLAFYRLAGIIITIIMFLAVVVFMIFLFFERRGRQRIAEQRDRAKLFFELTPSGIFTIDENKTITSWNKKAEEITGYPADELIGQKCTIFTKSPCLERGCGLIDPEVEKPILGKECTFQTRDGKYLVIMKNADVLKDQKGNIIGGIESFEDITDRKKMENALAESERRYVLAMDAINEGIWDYNPQTEELYLSPAWFAMLGYHPDEMPSTYKAWQELVHPEDLPEVAQAVVDFLEGRLESYHIEHRMRYKDGSWRWVLSRAKIVERDGSGLVTRMVGTHSDITDRRIAEIERKKAMEIKSKFISTVSHELRTPLGPIKEGVAIILDGIVGDINDQQRELLSTVKRNAERLNRLINDVLDFQKLEFGVMKFKKEENSINDLVKENQETMSLVSKQKGISLDIEIDDSIPLVCFDRDKIEQVLTNLVNNAIKFTDKGNVIIKTQCEKKVIHVIVSDTGLGIKEEDKEKLFQSFQQLETSHGRKTGGTGLGLAICKEILFYHHGKIWAESVFGQGSSFHFILPIKEWGGEYGKENSYY